MNMENRIFVAVKIYTENCIGAIGAISSINAYKTKEEAYARIRRDFEHNNEGFKMDERMITQPDFSKVLEATCGFADFEGNEIRYMVKEVILP